MRKSVFDTAPTEWVPGCPYLGLPELQGSDVEYASAARIRDAGLRRLFAAPSGLDIRAQHEVLQLIEELCTETSAVAIISRAHDYLGADGQRDFTQQRCAPTLVHLLHG